ncbi:MAG: FAD-dependent thymidylate synthase [Planctomycetota bacterium]|jgi:thymidylate synthase (FAD)
MSEVNPKVTLVRCTPDSDELIASAAKLCYASKTDKILDQEKDKASDFIEKLIGLGHMSPIEHVAFTFYLEGISRTMTHQLVRHRIASYSQRSQRYVKHNEFDYIMPPAFSGKSTEIDGKEVKAEEYYHETMDLIAERYKVLNQMLGDKGESSNEDARYILPNACETKIFMTMNARELIHFFEERTCQRAQWEIRGVAEEMLRIAREHSPALFSKIGPKCIRHKSCPEGEKTCGKHIEMKEKYLSDSNR